MFTAYGCSGRWVSTRSWILISFGVNNCALSPTDLAEAISAKGSSTTSIAYSFTVDVELSLLSSLCWLYDRGWAGCFPGESLSDSRTEYRLMGEPVCILGADGDRMGGIMYRVPVRSRLAD